MKVLLAVVSLAALGGCAVVPAPGYYYSAAPQSYDPYQWHTVSSEPVYRSDGPSEYAYAPQRVYVPAPVYVPQPVYAPQPYFYTPPVTIGLDFMFGGWYGGHGGRGHHRGRR